MTSFDKRTKMGVFDSNMMMPPMVIALGYKSLTLAAQDILHGIYTPPPGIDEYIKKLLKQFAALRGLVEAGTRPNSISLDSYQSYWKRAHKNTASFPSAISLPALKAGSTG
jgi:hypothetical protein